MPKQPEYLLVGLDLPLHFEFDLRAHEHKLVLDLVGIKITPDLDEFLPGFVDFSIPDQLAW